ncbi:MAG: Calx-beta domain-containing protein, partial [Robiginitalea sp.]
MNFSADWVESNETTDPSAGRIQINSNQLRFDNLDGRYISRSLDLSSATSVTLSFDYDATSRGNESLLVRLWDTGTSSYQTIVTINTSTSGSISYTLTANQISSLSSIRLEGGDSFWSSGERIFIDNILFTATLGPVISIDDITVNEGDGTATFTARHAGLGTSGPFSVNFQTVDGSATAGTDYTAISGGTLNFSGTVGDTEEIVVSLTDDNDFEGSETFIIELTGSSD